MKLIKKAGKKRMSKKRRTVKRRKRRTARTVVMAAPRRRRRTRRSYAAKSTIRRRSRRGVSVPRMKVGSIIQTGLTAAVGAGLAILLTNTVNKYAKVDSTKKNWLFLGSAIALGLILPKIKAVKKYAAPVTMGAIAVAGVRLASETLGMGKYLTLAGDESEELDKIISNLQIQGSNVSLMGSNVSLMGISEEMDGIEEDSLLGIAETMAGMEDEDDEY